MTKLMTQVNGKLEEDIFEKSHSASGDTVSKADPLSAQELPEGFDELPIELISLINRYVSFDDLHHSLLTALV